MFHQSRFTTGNTRMFNSIVPGEPSGFRKPTKAGTFNGRKFVEQEKSLTSVSTNAAGGSNRQKKILSNADDIERLLENDADALLNMRKDINIAQNAELEKAKQSLKAIQKEYDTAKIHNDIREKECASLRDRLIALKELDDSAEVTRESYRVKIKELNTNISNVQENMEAEYRTRDALTFMTNRLKEEINACKVQTHELNHQLDFVRGEFHGIDATLRLSKQELIEEELKVQNLSKTVKERSEQRHEKMNELQSIVLEGEASIAKVQELMTVSLARQVGINYISVSYNFIVCTSIAFTKI